MKGRKPRVGHAAPRPPPPGLPLCVFAGYLDDAGSYIQYRNRSEERDAWLDALDDLVSIKGDLGTCACMMDDLVRHACDLDGRRSVVVHAICIRFGVWHELCALSMIHRLSMPVRRSHLVHSIPCPLCVTKQDASQRVEGELANRLMAAAKSGGGLLASSDNKRMAGDGSRSHARASSVRKAGTAGNGAHDEQDEVEEESDEGAGFWGALGQRGGQDEGEGDEPVMAQDDQAAYRRRAAGLLLPGETILAGLRCVPG